MKNGFFDFFFPMPFISVSRPNLGIVLGTNQKLETKTSSHAMPFWIAIEEVLLWTSRAKIVT